MSDLIEKCKSLKIDYINKKTNKPYGKPALLKRIQEIEQKSLIKEEIQENIIEYKNEIIWSCVENKEYNDYEKKLLNLIKRCHDILYSNGAIVGTDASNDIIKILILRFINIIYKTKDGKEKINKLIEKIEEKERFLPYIIDFNELLNEETGNYENEIKIYISEILTEILPDIFNSEDGFLNTRNDPENIYKIIKEITEIITLDNTNISNYFSTQGGNIYEYFTNNYGKGNNTSKDLGQFFTPYNLIQAILYGCGFNDLIKKIKNPNLYDPCCGSGGLLCITYKNNKDFINSNEIYGCEIEKKTIKYALGSFIINTNELNTNILNCCSLSKNPYIFTNKKFDVIFSNPPFGIKNNYKEKKKIFEEFRDKFYNGNSVKFEDVYPLNINDGTIMFIQLIIYLLNNNGICAIILPDGKIMNTNPYYKIRKFIIDKCKILKIINIESGAFGHTTIKTKVIIFKKIDNDGNNYKSIEFLEINKNCNQVKLIAIGDLNKNYSFNLEKEIKDEIVEYTGEIKIEKLGNICKLKNGTNITKDDLIEGEFPVIGGGQKPMGYHNKYNCEENTILISKDGSYAGYISKYNIKTFITNHGIIINNINNDIINNDYLYYYLKFIQNNIYKLQSGLGQPGIKVIDLENLEIPIPILEKQEEIVSYFNDFFKDKDIKILSNHINNKFDLLFKNYKEFNKKITMLYNLNNTNQKIQDTIDNIKNSNKDIIEITINNNETEYIEFGRLFDLIKGKTQSSKVVEDENGNGVFINWSIYNKYKKISNTSLNGENLFISTNLPNGKNKGYMVITYYNGLCDYCDLMSLCKIKQDYIDKIYIKYIYYLLFDMKEYIEENYQKGLAQKSLDIEKFNLMEIPIPSLEVQEEIINIINNNEKTIENLENKIKFNEELMKKIF